MPKSLQKRKAEKDAKAKMLAQSGKAAEAATPGKPTAEAEEAS